MAYHLSGYNVLVFCDPSRGNSNIGSDLNSVQDVVSKQYASTATNNWKSTVPGRERGIVAVGKLARGSVCLWGLWGTSEPE